MSSTTPNRSRSPLWFCYECHAEMRPLMNPEPHCASCNGTFLEEMDGTGEDDPRQIAAENEQSTAILNLLQSGLLGPRPPHRGGPTTREYRGASSPTSGSGRSSRTNDLGSTSPFGGFGAGGGMPPFAPFGAANMPSGSSIRFEVRSGPNGRSFTYQRGNSSSGRGTGAQDDFPSFPEFLNQRMNSAPTSPVDDEIETPFGPRFRRPGTMPTTPLEDPRAALMQYLVGVLSGNPALLFEDHAGPFQGNGAFGDYVFNQEGLDRIITQLMEAAGQHKPNPAPEDMIANLKRTNLTYDCDLVKSGQSCAICTEYFAPPDTSSQSQSQPKSSTDKDAPVPEENTGTNSSVAITLPCGHPFHDDCIITWLKSSGTCPVCRFALVEQPIPSGPGGAPVPPAPGAASTSTSIPTGNLSISTAAGTSTSPEATSSTRPINERVASSSSGTGDITASPQQQADTFFHTLGGPTGVLESIFGLLGGNQHRDQGAPDLGAGGQVGRDPSFPSTWPSSSNAANSSSGNTGLSTSPSQRASTPRIRTPIPNPSSSPPNRVPTPSSRNNRSPNRSPSPSPMPAPPLFFRDRLSPRPNTFGSGLSSPTSPGNTRPNQNNSGNTTGHGNTPYLPGSFEDVD